MPTDLTNLVRDLDKAASKGIIHKKTASRKVSRAMRKSHAFICASSNLEAKKAQIDSESVKSE
ncbi:Ribosomal protein S20 [Candidatus Omnitrophus magneticus]|uniref:Small ribosomal subunit protein bS20 n=1 Tax=Candidatus Omnitrophus magneticus TaxID=1609969 RepID=A0A0F0CL66_9BACT|nr:Ribosomal protein S20 [Candidatus Omnitrophus magneticus]